jgi:tetratricopeptide (TPR) repeat protein
VAEQEREQRRLVEEKQGLLEQKQGELLARTKDAEDARRDAGLELHDNQRVLLRAAWDAGDRAKLKVILDQMRPRPGRPDLRGFETHYLDRQVHAEVERTTYDPPVAQPVSEDVRDWYTHGRLLYRGSVAQNRHYGTVTALDLATGQPATGFTPVELRWNVSHFAPRLHVVPGDPPRLWTASTLLAADRNPTRKRWLTLDAESEWKVWDARTGRLLAGCESLLPDPELTQQGWMHRFLRLCFTGETANRDATVVITQLVREVKGIDGEPATESRAQLHDFKTGRTIRCLDARPGLLDRAQFSFDDRFVVTLHRQVRTQQEDRLLFTVWDAATGKSVWAKQTPHDWRGFTRDGNSVAFGSRSGPFGFDQAVEAFDLATGAPRMTTGTFSPRPDIPFVADLSFHRQPGTGAEAVYKDRKLGARDLRTGLLLDVVPYSGAQMIGVARQWVDDAGRLIVPLWSERNEPLGLVSAYRRPRAELTPLSPVGPREYWETKQQADGRVKFQCLHRTPDPGTGPQRKWRFEQLDPVTGTTRRVDFRSESEPVPTDRSWIETAGDTLVVTHRSHKRIQPNVNSWKRDLRLSVFDLATGRERFTTVVTEGFLWKHDYLHPFIEAFEVVLSADGRRLAAFDHTKREVIGLDAISGERLWAVPVPPDEKKQYLHLFLPDGGRFILYDSAGTLRVFDGASGRLIKETADGPKDARHPGNRNTPWGRLRVTADERTVYFDEDGVLTLIDTANWAVRHRLGTKPQLNRESGSWQSAGDRFALLRAPTDWEVWDVHSGHLISRFELSSELPPPNRALVGQAVYGPDGTRAFLLSDTSVRVIDLARGREVLAVPVHRYTGEAHLALSADASELTITSLHGDRGVVLRRVLDARPLSAEELARGKRLDAVRPPDPKPPPAPRPDRPPVTASDYLDLALRAGDAKPHEAVAALREALKLDPEFGVLHKHLARLLQKTGDPGGALVAYRTAVRLDPGDYDAWSQIAWLLERSDRSAAIEAFREALKADPRRPTSASARYIQPTRATIHDSLAWNLREGGHLVEAEGEYRTALKAYADSEKELGRVVLEGIQPERIVVNLAACLLRQGKVKEAAAECEGLFKKLPDGKPDPRAAADIGEMYLWEDRYPEAVDWSERAIKLWTEVIHPDALSRPGFNDPRRYAHCHKAIALNWLDRGKEAVAAIDESIKLAPPADKTYQRMMRARYVAKTGDHAEAAKQVKALLAEPNLNPNHWDAALAYALCARAAKGDEKLQEEYAVEAVRLLRRVLDARQYGYPWRTDRDLNSIRERADFRALVTELNRSVPPPVAPAPSEKR